MTDSASQRTVFDPFLNKDVQVSDRLVDRLRGRYACGPTLPNGEPEFGWREFQTPPIQHEAAARISELEAERDELQRALLFWMPGVDVRLGAATQERAANDAYLLSGYRGPLDGPCWGDAILDRALAAESELSRVEVERNEFRAALKGLSDMYGSASVSPPQPINAPNTEGKRMSTPPFNVNTGDSEETPLAMRDRK